MNQTRDFEREVEQLRKRLARMGKAFSDTKENVDSSEWGDDFTNRLPGAADRRLRLRRASTRVAPINADAARRGQDALGPRCRKLRQ